MCEGPDYATLVSDLDEHSKTYDFLVGSSTMYESDADDNNVLTQPAVSHARLPQLRSLVNTWVVGNFAELMNGTHSNVTVL